MDELTPTPTLTSTPTLTNSLNLLDYCKRAIGEWQSLEPNQSRLISVETGVKKMSNYFSVDQELIIDPRTSVVDFCGASQEFIDSISCTRVTVGELYRCDTPGIDIFKDGVLFIRGGPDNPIPMSGAMTHGDATDIAEIVPLSTYTDTDITVDNRWMIDLKVDPWIVRGMSLEEKEELYWALKFRNRGCSIVPGIIESIPGFVKMGYDSWLLPNGARVPLSALKLRVLEVVPKELFVFRVLDYYQVGGTICGDLVVPDFARVPKKSLEPRERNLGILMRRFDPQLGPTLAHYVAEVELDDGKSYIVDPTSTQFKYRGPKRSIIAHGEWGDYVAKFPGMVLGKVEASKYGNFPTVELESYCRGDGLLNFIMRLESNLNTYLGRRICRYCGRIEGEHLVAPKPGFRYKPVPLELRVCLRCKDAAYCGTVCHKLDWKNHKGFCRYKA